ncbi:MAG: hypothetical protein JJU46_12495 [Balneolaceae bacterium]|nr:hypothetical protein [Balneolaceae bacterium]MCH8547611.1 hypothetical protein [Balneolaceae bacterium]
MRGIILRKSPARYLRVCIAALILLAGCSTGTSLYSETAYRQGVELKVRSLEMISKASESYSDHQSEAEMLRRDLIIAYEYAKGRPDNEISTRQWQIMVDPDRSLMIGFLDRWKDRERLSPAFIREYRELVSEAFDQIIGLESGKIHPSSIAE